MGGSGQGSDTTDLFAQNHFSCCVKNRMKAGAKDGHRGTIRRGAPDLDQEPAGMWPDVARFQICFEGGANRAC